MKTEIDVLLVNPGDRKAIFQDLGNDFVAVEPPVFCGLFATYLRNKGVSVAVYDAPALNVTAEEVAKAIVEDYRPALVVLVVYGAQPSASTQNMTSAGNIATRVKEISPQTPIMMTGTHPAALPWKTMFQEAVDFVCDGEGPVTILKTVQALKAGGTGLGDIPSLWSLGYGGRPIIGPQSAEPLIKDLDGEMPGIAWDLLPMEKYRAHDWHSFRDINARSPYGAVHTSLGCPYSCHFCCINAPFGKSGYRMWSPETAVREIDFLAHEHGVVNIKFVDEMFVLNKNHVLGICELLKKRDYDINIWAYARVDTVEDRYLDALKAAGVEWLALGIESASDYVRDGAKKKFENDDIVEVVRKIQGAGINVIGNFIFGLPDDTPERMQETLYLALQLRCEYANFYSAMAYPGSELHRQAVAKHRELPEKWEDYSQHGYGTKPLANEFCTSAEILAFRDAAWQRYFTDPGYLSMVGRKFGQGVVDHICRMTRVRLRRKLIETA